MSRLDNHRIPEATVSRLPVYRRALHALVEAQCQTTSSEQLAELSGVNAAKVRKDLSYLGSHGTRGVGYEVQHLLHQIELALGLHRESPVVIVGLGNLGQALANYGGFRERGFPIAALIDEDPAKVARRHGSLTVHHPRELHRLVKEHAIAVGIIATPSAAAQAVADCLVAAGVRSILNFAPAVISVPASIPVRQVDLATELEILSFYQQPPVVLPQRELTA